MKYRQLQINPIEVREDPQMRNVGLSYLYPDIPEKRKTVRKIREEFKNYAASVVRAASKGVAEQEGVPEEHVLAVMKSAVADFFRLSDEPFDGKGSVHDYVANLFTHYGIDIEHGVFTAHRRFDPLTEDDERFQRFIQKLDLKRPMTEEERVPAVLRTFSALEDYIPVSRIVGQRHTLEDHSLIYVGIPSVENFPMQERVYEQVAASDFGRNGPFELHVLPSHPVGFEGPPLIHARFSGALERAH